jgi:eukaryotic-like serine/threonine-protein kinase
MATVYVAHDLRHDRKVAIKVMRPDISAILGGERFLHEIRTTANLQHPHILPLHDSGSVEGTVFYVMPFVEGESLRARLHRERQLPVADAVRFAQEVASALAYAHRRGVIHRDIKPENILLHEGRALVADFGIALAVSSAGGGQRMTESGMSLGTPQYMSPEQAMGERNITGRSDVYALGCVLYEMLLGEPPFTGPTAQAIVARIVTDEPRPLVAQRRTIPLNVEAAVLVALAKLPADRFATPDEFATALGNPSFNSGLQAVALPSAPHSTWRAWVRDRRTLVVAAIAVLAVISAVAGQRIRAGAIGEPTSARLVMVVPEALGALLYNPGEHGPPVVSADGRAVAFSFTRDDTTAVFIKRADRFDVEVVPAAARRPFFSPDGAWLGFLQGNSVWKIAVAGGEPVVVGDFQDADWNVRSQAWHQNGTILISGSLGVWALPQDGGNARLVYRTDTVTREVVEHVSVARSGHIVLSIKRAERSSVAVLTQNGEMIGFFPDNVEGPAWAVEDVLVFVQSGQRMAAHADFRRQRLNGRSLPVQGLPFGVPIAPSQSVAWVDPSSQRMLEPVWVTRSGIATSLGLAPSAYRWPRLSPDGRRLAMRMGDGRLYVVDLATGGRVRLEGEAGASEPVWLSDGRRVVFGRGNVPMPGLLEQPADASGPPDTLFIGATESFPTSISPDDSLVLFYSTGADDPVDLYVLDRATRSVRRLSMPGAQRGGRFSPNGRWIAYQSNDAGQMDIYVRPWPSMNARYVVSTEGGEEPVWSSDGRELYYRTGDRIMAVRVSDAATFTTSRPAQLFHGPYPRDPWGDQSFDVAPDGRFLMLRVSEGSPLQLFIIQNWFGEIRRQLRQ